jgi:hypothetical protein
MEKEKDWVARKGSPSAQIACMAQISGTMEATIKIVADNPFLHSHLAPSILRGTLSQAPGQCGPRTFRT